MGIEELLTAFRCPWQNPFVERLIDSLRRECLDHVIVWNKVKINKPSKNIPPINQSTAIRGAK